MEMYEQQEPFKLQDFINMSLFLNVFVYKTVMGQLLGEFIYNKINTSFFLNLLSYLCPFRVILRIT